MDILSDVKISGKLQVGDTDTIPDTCGNSILKSNYAAFNTLVFNQIKDYNSGTFNSIAEMVHENMKTYPYVPVYVSSDDCTAQMVSILNKITKDIEVPPQCRSFGIFFGDGGSDSIMSIIGFDNDNGKVVYFDYMSNHEYGSIYSIIASGVGNDISKSYKFNILMLTEMI